MGLIAGRLARAIEKRATLADPPAWLFNAFGATATAAGKAVNDQTAITFSAVYAAVKILGESIASLPLIYYRRLEPRGKQRATGEQLYDLLRYQPNPEQTAVEFWEFMVGNVCLRGNAYAVKVLDGRGRVSELWPLPANQCTLIRREGNIFLEWRPETMAAQVFESSAFMRISNLSYDGLTGLSPIAVSRQGIGLALAAEEYGARLFSNDARPGGVLEHPGTLTTDVLTRLRDTWDSAHQGASNAHRAAILEEGMKWTQIGITPEDAQFLASRKFQIQEIARIYRLPPHKLGDLTDATFSNIEHQGLEFVTDSLMPWLSKIEQAIRRDLIPPQDQRTHFAEFLVNGLLRGDSAARSTYYRERWSLGSLSPNDIRELENENPVDGGDEYYVPLNFIPISQDAPPEPPPAPAARKAPERRSLAHRRGLGTAFRQLFEDAAERIRKLEDVELRKLAKKHLLTRDLETFAAALDELYAEDGRLRGKLAQIMGPVFAAYARNIWGAARDEIAAEPGTESLEGFTPLLVAGFVSRHAISSAGQMKTVSRETDAFEAVEGRLEQWRATRPGRIAAREIAQSNGAVAMHAFRTAGVTKKQWVAFGDTCPYCTGLDGKIVGIEAPFANRGDSFGSTDPAQGPLKIANTRFHPPIHPGCDCAIVAV